MHSFLLSTLFYSLLLILPWTQAVPLQSDLTQVPPRAVTTVKAIVTTKSSAKATTTTVKTSVKPSTTIKTSSKSSTLLTTTTSATPATPSTTSTGPVVTDAAYIDTILRHHNVHRANHSASALTWSTTLADTARKISAMCIFQHNLTTDGGGYGQNIGAGFPATTMGRFVTGSLYNGEVNAYTYYGSEPNINTLSQWGHFSQIVWKATTSVGCYTYDCSSTGLGNTASNVPPYFTVCNYSPQGNYIGSFTQNVGASLLRASIDGTYECGTTQNCVGPTQ